MKGRKKRDRKTRQQKPAPPPSTLKIELEPDAEQLFRQAVADFSEQNWKASKSQNDPKSAKRSAQLSLPLELDLHGLTLEEAREAVTEFINNHRLTGSGMVTLNIITGKGRHSATSGGIPSREIHSHVVKAFQSIIVDIEAAPADTEIRTGVLWRGHFHVTIRRG